MYSPTEINKHYGGIQKTYEFDNGYGASVIRHKGSYGYAQGKWELAVLEGDELCYTSPITEDVIGHLTEDEVESILKQIKEL